MNTELQGFSKQWEHESHGTLALLRWFESDPRCGDVRKKSVRPTSGSRVRDFRACDPGRSCASWLIG